jgi:signal transduction histidine kinase
MYPSPFLLRITIRLVMTCAIAGVFQPAWASDLLQAHRRFIDLHLRDGTVEQRELIDSLIANAVPASHTMGVILQARLAMAQGRTDQADSLLTTLGQLDDLEDHVLLYAFAETYSNINKAKHLLPKAMEQANRAMGFAEAFSMEREMIDILVLQASIERGQDKLSQALKLAIDAEKRATVLDYVGGLCKALVQRGNIYYDQERWDMAKSFYRRCYGLSIANGFTHLVKFLTANLAAAIQTHPDSTEAAIAIYRQAIAHAQRTGDGDAEADWRAVVGTMLSSLGRHDDAIVEIRRSMAYYQRIGDQRSQSYPLYYLAGAHEGSGNTDSALVYATQSLELAERVRDLELIVGCERIICDLLAASDPRLADHWNNYVRSRDSLESEKLDDQLYDMEGQYEGEKKSLEIAAQDAIIDKQGIQLLATAAISALLILLTFILYRNLRHRKRLAKKERELYEQQMGDVMRQSEIRSLDSLMQGQEMERKRVAKDLHDRLGSMLSAIKLQFGALEGRVESVREENKQQYQHVTTLLDDAVGEVRRISHDMLKSSLAQFGLAGALDDLRQALSAPGKLEVEMILFGLEERMEQKVEIAAFRMVQECVSNALKHAKATAITISVTRTTGALNVMVEDNGKGFDMSKVNEGMGLGNLRQRAAEVGGAVQFDSRPGHGTTVTIDVPLT